MIIKDYFEYEYRLAKDAISPIFRAVGLDFDGKTILDVGCGHGGVLHFLSDHFAINCALGIDIDRQAIERANLVEDKRLRFEVQDFLQMTDSWAYDVVILRDVLEHIILVEQALRKACALVRKEGYLYLSYAPFFSPFGGHQHNGTGFFSFIPWLQILPEQLFLRLIRLRGNTYKSKKYLEPDARSVLATRITIKKMASFLSRSGMKVLSQSRYLVRPDYEIKFGMKTLSLPKTYLPILTELFCTGEELILQKLC